MAQVILVTAGKGGVGKSVVLTGLALALCEQGQRVVAVEGSRPALDLSFGLSGQVVFTLEDLWEERCTLEDALLPVQGEQLELLCTAPRPALPPAGAPEKLCAALEKAFDFILVEVDGTDEQMLAAWAKAAQRAVIVSTADPVSARGGRVVSDLLDGWGVEDLRLCINMLPREFAANRPVPHLDWMIDTVCAQLIAVLPFAKELTVPVQIGKKLHLSNLPKMIFDNFAQRILGEYLDLLVH